jgi:pyruvate dehydrogenase E1 component alpha subunit
MVTVLPDLKEDGVSTDTLLDWLRTMLLIRAFERESVRLSVEGKIPGGVHSSEGQEAVAVGAIGALGPDDVVAGTHRSHHHALAKGLTPRSVMAELFGKADGCAGGRGGSMHLVDPALHYLGSNGIVGGGLGLAMGASLAFQLRAQPIVAIGFFGDGGGNTGRVWETINLASVWKLPLIVMCENNLYAVETHVSTSLAGGSLAARARGFGLPAVVVDGQDVLAVYRVTREARNRALAGQGPTFIEAQTYRYEGHNVGDVQNYRTKEEVDRWRQVDPIEKLRNALQSGAALGEAAIGAMTAEAGRIVADAVRTADAGAWPEPPPVGTAWPDASSRGLA